MRSEWISDLAMDRRFQGAHVLVAKRLHEATHAAQEWKPDAACRGMSPELFFTERGENFDNREAKAVCAGCRVRAECLEYAMSAPEREGVWGGLSAKERRTLRRTRGRRAA